MAVSPIVLAYSIFPAFSDNSRQIRLLSRSVNVDYCKLIQGITAIRISFGEFFVKTTIIARQFSTLLSKRIRKIDSVASETTLYYNNYNWQVLAEYNGSNNCQRYFVYGNYIDEPLLMVNVAANPDVDYYYVHDHLYSPVALLASDGTMAECYE